MYIEIEPQGIRVAWRRNTPLLDLLQNHSFDIITSICGGNGTCGKCRVRIVSGKVSDPTEEEKNFLSPDELKSGIRLACQTIAHESINLRIVEPVSRAQYKTRLEMSPVTGDITTNVKKVYLELPRPSLDDHLADTERLIHGLHSEKVSAAELQSRLLPLLPGILRGADWKITATLINDQIVDVEKGNTTEQNYGIAVDLGTTTIAAYLVDLNNGNLLKQAALTNRQSRYGEDVMTRIDRAHSGDLEELQKAAVTSMNILVDGLRRKSAIKRQSIYEAVVVGNTCMHHLLLGIDPYTAGIAPFTPAINFAPDVPATNLGIKIADGGSIHLPPIISGFVGADTVADVLALDFDRPQAPHLVIDIGTNAEMALAADGKIRACSAAAGPAFEGARISCGMRAAPGAVDRADFVDNVQRCRTIDNKPATGIAGSGLISVAAALKRYGLLNRRGGVRQKDIPAAMLDKKNRGIVLVPAEQTASGQPLILTWRDLGEELVIAKAAIRTGIQVLIREAGINYDDIDRISIAGAFGNFLAVSDALEIGLLPNIEPTRISGVGNAAGNGAIQMLLSREERIRARHIAQRIQYVELSGYPDFNRMFSANMRL